jgi:hypothetical protein
MQHALRQIDGRISNAQAARDSVMRVVQKHQDGRPPADDLTLVVGRIKPGRPY